MGRDSPEGARFVFFCSGFWWGYLRKPISSCRFGGGPKQRPPMLSSVASHSLALIRDTAAAVQAPSLPETDKMPFSFNFLAVSLCDRVL